MPNFLNYDDFETNDKPLINRGVPRYNARTISCRKPPRKSSFLSVPGTTTDSRGLLEQTAYKGISPSAVKYLEERDLGLLVAEVRNPRPIRFDDLEGFDLIVGLSRDEHEGMFLTRFGQIPRHLAKQGRLRYWNVDDLPRPGSRLVRALTAIFSGKQEAPSQREESGTEHINFAVQSLVRELDDSAK
jgi:protein-tyrosine-phosphatase